MANAMQGSCDRWLFTPKTLRKTPYVSENKLRSEKAWEEEEKMRKNAVYHLMALGQFLKM